MHAVQVTSYGGPEVLKATELPEPKLAHGEILVRVRSANINPTDLMARQGHVVGDPVPTPYILGWDYAGEVRAVGSGASGFKVGDRVVGMIPWYVEKGTRGAYAQLIPVKADWTVALPDSVDYDTACTIPLNALTAEQALALLGAPAKSSILITGASGAVGGFAVQLAVKAGHIVTAVAGRDDEAWVKSLGAERVLPRDVDYREIGKFKFMFDAVPVGAPAFSALAEGGRVITTRPLPKADASRALDQQFVLIRSDETALKNLIAMTSRGELKTRVSRAFPLAEAAEAHRVYEKGGLKGKIILHP